MTLCHIQVLRVVCMNAVFKEIYLGDKLNNQGQYMESFNIRLTRIDP